MSGVLTQVGTRSHKRVQRVKKWFNCSYLWAAPTITNSTIFFLKKWPTPASFLFIFVLFKHKFYRKNCRLQQDSNLDHRSWRQARWPLDHHHSPYLTVFDIVPTTNNSLQLCDIIYFHLRLQLLLSRNQVVPSQQRQPWRLTAPSLAKWLSVLMDPNWRIALYSQTWRNVLF